MTMSRTKNDKGRLVLITDRGFAVVPIKEIKKRTKRRKNSQGFNKKMEPYFQRLLKADSFQAKIQQMRQRYNIPQNGFNISYKKSSFWGPPTSPPKSWMDKITNKLWVELCEEVEKFCASKGLYSSSWTEILLSYLFYNLAEMPSADLGLSFSYNLCEISDLKYERDELTKKPGGQKIIEGLNSEFPVAIRVSPYASRNDIVDFVTKNFSDIKKLQERYKKEAIKIGKVRPGDPKKALRNEFIYKNRDKPLKQIRKMLAKQFGEYLDDGHIGKIISYEREKRKAL